MSRKKGFKHSKETKQRMSKAHQGETSGMLGKNHTDEAKRKIREAGKSRKITWGNKISKARKGMKFSKQHCENLSKGQRGKINELANNWKGDKISKGGVHGWIAKHKGKASEYKCEYCGKQARDWSNKKHDYKRNLDDYVALCRSCHMKYDIKYNNKTWKKHNKHNLI